MRTHYLSAAAAFAALALVLSGCTPYYTHTVSYDGDGGTIDDAQVDGTDVPTDFSLEVADSGNINYGETSENGVTLIEVQGLRHPYSHDLTFTLLPPDGDPVIIKNAVETGYFSIFDGDYAFTSDGTGTEQYVVVYDGANSVVAPDTYNAYQDMTTAFDDQSVTGTWTLRITDGITGGAGTFTGWTMTVRYTNSTP